MGLGDIYIDISSILESSDRGSSHSGWSVLHDTVGEDCNPALSQLNMNGKCSSTIELKTMTVVDYSSCDNVEVHSTL